MRIVATSPGNTSLRVALWAFATVVGVLLVVMSSATSSSAATDGAVDETSGDAAPVAGLLSDLTDGATRPLTDTLESLTAPVEKVAAPVTQPLRDVVTPRGASEKPPAPSAAAPTTHAPAADGVDDSGPSAETSTRDADRGQARQEPVAPSAPLVGDEGAAASPEHVSPDARDRLDALFSTATTKGLERSVDVGDLDWGPRPLAGSDHHTTAAATALVMAWTVAGTQHVGRDDLLLEVRRGHDTAAATQNFTQPDVSPG